MKEDRKSVVLSVRVTETEREKLKLAAQQRGITCGEFLISQALAETGLSSQIKREAYQSLVKISDVVENQTEYECPKRQIREELDRLCHILNL